MNLFPYIMWIGLPLRHGNKILKSKRNSLERDCSQVRNLFMAIVNCLFDDDKVIKEY